MSLERWLDRAGAVRDFCSLCWNDPYLLYRLRRYKRHLTYRFVRAYSAAVRDVPTYHDMAEAWRARAQERRNTGRVAAYDYTGAGDEAQRLHALWLEGRTNIPATRKKTEESL